MKYGFLYKASPLAKIFFSAFIVLASFLFCVVIGMILAVPIFKIDIFQLPSVFSNLSEPENIRILKYFQIIQSIGLFVIPPFFIGCFIYKSSIQYLYINHSPKIYSLLLVIIIMFAAIPVINFVAEINSQLQLPEFFSSVEKWLKEIEENAREITEAFLQISGTRELLVNLFMIAILPAVGEELLFRGVFQRIFIEWTKNIHIGIFLAAFFFSTLHFQFYGFFPRLMLGIFFGYLLVWSNTIWLPVLAHFVNNGAAVIFYYLFHNKIINDDIETIGTNLESLTYVIISALLVSLLIFVLYKKEKVGDT